MEKNLEASGWREAPELFQAPLFLWREAPNKNFRLFERRSLEEIGGSLKMWVEILQGALKVG